MFRQNSQKNSLRLELNKSCARHIALQVMVWRKESISPFHRKQQSYYIKYDFINNNDTSEMRTHCSSLKSHYVTFYVHRVIPTALYEEQHRHTAREVTLQSSRDEQLTHQDNVNDRRLKRLFFEFLPSPITIVMTTAYTSSSCTVETTTTTLTDYSSYTCLPPGTLVCPSAA